MRLSASPAEMARKAERSGEQSPGELNQQSQDLDKLMDRMEEAARNGTREDAEAMLDQMQEMFENMRSADEDEESPAEQANAKADRTSSANSCTTSRRCATTRSAATSAIASGSGAETRWRRAGPGRPGPAGRQRAAIRRQGDKDETAPSRTSEEPTPTDRTLEQRQRALRDRLAELRRELKRPRDEGRKGVQRREGDMKEAEGDLKDEQRQSGEQGGAATKVLRQQGKGGRARQWTRRDAP